MTTASETTIKLLQNRIEILKREEADADTTIGNLENDLSVYKGRRALMVAEREALEADLAARTVAEKVTIPGGDVECPKCHAKPGEVCTPIQGGVPRLVAMYSHLPRRNASERAREEALA